MSLVEKALAHKVNTSDTRSIWQEVFDRIAPVRPESVQTAQELFRKYTGSWAGVYSIGGAVKSNHLGQRGMGEINFRPYDFRTSSANRAPSLIGHPVSFEVVGPTLKNKNNDWQWLLTDNSVTPGIGDVLTLDLAISGNQSPLGTPATSQFSSIEDIYGLTVADGLPLEGLYFVVSETGYASYNGITAGGLGDGSYGDASPSVQTPIQPLSSVSRYEIFRITEFTATALTLDAGKRIATYFDTSAGQTVVRAITLIRPKAARMQVIPQSGGLVYAVLPPEYGLVGDHRPAFSVWDSATPNAECVWANDILSEGTSYRSDEYLLGDAVPIPKPLYYGVGHVVGEPTDGTFVPGYLGELSIVVEVDTALQDGRLIHITDVKSVGSPTAMVYTGAEDSISDPGIESLKGWYTIKVSTNANGLTELLAKPSFDPTTGALFDPPPDTYFLREGERIQLRYTVHNPISQLWSTRTLKMNDLASAKLSNLIDPSWSIADASSMLSAAISSLRGPVAMTKAHGRAVFDTASMNPGSLNDLGFEMVLYPAQMSGPECIPDFSRPINPNHVVLDSTQPTTSQSIYVDYASGTCTLSHAPVVNANCEICPDEDTLSALNNPRGEIVLYACFVPYSMEEGQNAFGIHTSGVYNNPLVYTLASQTITIPDRPNKFTVDVVELISATEIPQTGFFDLFGYSALPLFTYTATPTTPLHTCEYYKFEQTSGVTRFYCTGGGSDGESATIHGNSANGRLVIRRDLVLPASNFGNDVGVSSAEDTTYGSAVVSNSITHANSRVDRDAFSGALTVTNEQAERLETLVGETFTSCLISGAVVEGIPGELGITISEGVFLLNGVRTVVPPQTIPESAGAFGANTTRYVQLHGLFDPPFYTMENATTRSDLADVLIAQVTTDLTEVTDIIVMSLPLISVDRKLTVTVGYTNAEPNSSGTPNFATLAEAVSFAGSLMDPVSGADGLYLTIQVVGPTVETATPIPLGGVSGITIQGSLGPINGGTSLDTHGISWASNTSLFDLSDVTAVTMRDLKFVYSSSVSTRTTADRGLFTNPNGATAYLHISNVDFNGGSRAHFIGLFANHVTNSVFRDCRFTNITDQGFQHTSTATKFLSCVFDHVSIQIGTAQKVGSDEDAALSFYCTVSSSNVVKDCVFTGCDIGIILGGSNNHVDNCTIQSTRFSGLWAIQSVTDSFNKVANNNFYDVYTSTTSRPKIGVLAQSGTRAIYRGNMIRLNTDVGGNPDLSATDMAFQTIAGLNFTRFEENDVDWTVDLNGAYCRVSDNNILSGNLNIADATSALGGCVVKDNILANTTAAAMGSIVVASSAINSNISGNITHSKAAGSTYSIEVAAKYCIVEGNIAIEGINTTDDNVIVSGNICRNSGTLSDISADAQVSLVSGNIARNVVMGGSASIFSGNYISTDVTIGASTVLGTGNLVMGDMTATAFTGAAYVHNNFVLGTVALDTGTDVEGSMVSNNYVGEDLLLKNRAICVANRVEDTLSLLRVPESSVVLGNSAKISLDLNSIQYSTVIGNIAGESTGGAITSTANLSILSGDNCTVSSNIVTGNLDADSTTNQAISGNVVENYIQVPTTAAASFVLSGNIAASVATTAASPGPDVDPDVAPYSSIIVGNRFTNALPIFGTAVDGAGRSSNVKV